MIDVYEDQIENFELVYEFRNWPFIQASPVVKECYGNFHPESKYNINYVNQNAIMCTIGSMLALLTMHLL